LKASECVNYNAAAGAKQENLIWRKNMKSKTQNFFIALTIILAIASSAAFGQNKSEQQTASLTDEQANTLVGVWESVGPVSADCQTGEPSGPVIRALYSFHQGGTMTEENTDPIEGPYRNTGHGIWKRNLGGTYSAVYMHYGYLPDNTHLVTVKVKSTITLDRNLGSFTQNGTFEVFDSQGNPFPDENGDPIRGCFSDTANRLTF
jgi:hypothetical protein